MQLIRCLLHTKSYSSIFKIEKYLLLKSQATLYGCKFLVYDTTQVMGGEMKTHPRIIQLPPGQVFGKLNYCE